MPYPHVIRLRGPWEYESLASLSRELAGSSVPATEARPGPLLGRVTLPCDWNDTLGADFRGQVRYRRRFNRPTGLEPHERVWLVIEGVDPHGQYALNGQSLGPIHGYALPAESDVTELLAANNVLEIDISTEPAIAGSPPILRPGREQLAGGPIDEVRLEVRSRWFIDNLTLWWESNEPPTLRITGRVAASAEVANASTTAERTGAAVKLALSVTACERELLYREVSAEAEFSCALAIDDWPCWPDTMDEPVLTPVEIRLIADGTGCWQCVRETASPTAEAHELRRSMLAAARDTRSLVWLGYQERNSPSWQQLLATPRATVGLLAILPESCYADLDRANVAVVQQLPREWVKSAAQRLAHHPSVVAWCASLDDASRSTNTTNEKEEFGRPWLKSLRPV